MKMRNLMIAAATWALALVPPAGSAQDEEGGFMLEEAPAEEPEPLYASELEAGIGYNSEDSFKFGEYTGLTESEPFAILNFDILSRSDWQSEDTRYYRLRGERLGLDSRYVEGEYGNQGSYSVGLSYREIPHFLIDDALVPYRGTGGTILSLPAGWTPAASNQDFPDLGSSLRSVDIKNERQQVTGFLSLLPGDRWTADFKVSHENRDGTKPTLATFATNGGNPSIVAFPRPVEWSTNDIEATLGYAADRAQFELEYHGSFFYNDNSVLRFQNPYSEAFSGGPWAPEAGHGAFGGFGLPPDNESHQFLFSGGYTLGAASRLSGQLSYSMLEQDEQFLPYSSNRRLTVTRPLPRQSLDGDLGILVADLAYSTRLQPRTHLRARVRYEDQDNSTPRDVYVRIVGDAQDQPAGLANGNARINLPYSFDKFQFDTELSHRLTTRTKLGLEYEFENHSRTFSEVEETDEHSVEAKVRHRFSDTTIGRLSFRHGERDGDDPYRDNAPFLASHTTQLLNTLAPDDRFENHPEIRKYNLADRSLNEAKGMLHIAATPETSWSLHGSWLNEDFDDTSLGLTERQMLRGAVDLNHTFSELLMARAYYSFEQFDDELTGHSFRPFPPTNSLVDGKQRWLRDGRDRIHSLGAGFVWDAIPNKLDIEVDYSVSLADTEFEFQGGSEVEPIEDAPTLSSDRHTFQVTADWKLEEDRRLRVSYLFEDFDADDFALDGVGVNSNPRMLTFGNDAPDYSAHVIGLSYVANW